MPRFRAKYTVEAIQWDGTNKGVIDIMAWCASRHARKRLVGIAVDTETGTVYLEPGEWVARNSAGVYSAVREDDMRKHYSRMRK